jgi:WD40 repeat protein
VFSIVAHTGWVHTVAFSPDGRTIATGGGDRRIKLWHTETGQPLGSLLEERQGFEKLQFTRDGQRLVGKSLDDTLIVYDASP